MWNLSVPISLCHCWYFQVDRLYAPRAPSFFALRLVVLDLAASRWHRPLIGSRVRSPTPTRRDGRHWHVNWPDVVLRLLATRHCSRPRSWTTSSRAAREGRFTTGVDAQVEFLRHGESVMGQLFSFPIARHTAVERIARTIMAESRRPKSATRKSRHVVRP